MTAYRPSPKLLEVLAYLREREIAGPWKYLYDDYSAGTVFITRDPQDSQTPLVAGLTIEQAAPIVAALNAP